MQGTAVEKKPRLSLTQRILIAIIAGFVVGTSINLTPNVDIINDFFVSGILHVGGKIFIATMKMLVVPIVLVSLICGVSQLQESHKLGRLGIKTMSLYLVTTMIAITLGLVFANLFTIGAGNNFRPPSEFSMSPAPPLIETMVNIFPSNPFEAMVTGNMLQVIVFALFFGTAIKHAGKAGRLVQGFFNSMNQVVMSMITMLMNFAPYGVFCLVAKMFAQIGFTLVGALAGYFGAVLFVLFVHVTFTNTLLVRFIAKMNPLIFFRKMYSAMMFAFSTSSSNASIPIVLSTVEHRLGVKNSVASFVIPLGATINMDGTAIMQGIATVFIANSYNIDLGLTSYLLVIATATLASIGTAGVPSVGLITLAMVLQQVGLPVEGIALIIGIDRILDMVRTAVNITGDAAVSTVVAKTEGVLDEERFNDLTATLADELDEEIQAQHEAGIIAGEQSRQ